MRPAIRVENLSKQYRLGETLGSPYQTLRDALAEAAKAPLRRLFRRDRPGVGGGARGHFWALKDVSFEVKPGEVVGVIGRNGAGKSTLLKVLSRITEPTAGRAEIRGRVGSLLEVGTGFHPELTGRENIYLNGSILGMNRREIARKFDEIVAFSEIEKFLDTPVKRYSSGMYVRLAFAVAAHLEPEILIVDEVLAVGDAAFQRKCLGKMGTAAKEGRTVLFVSHNMAAIRSLCGRAIILNRGSVELDADAGSAADHYLGQAAPVQGEVRWDGPDAPQGDGLRLRRVYTTDEAGEVCSAVDFKEPFHINVEYELARPMAGVRVGITVTYSDGTVVFGSSDFGPRTADIKPAGATRSTCRVPGHTLNSGTFSITVAAEAPPAIRPLFWVDHCLQVMVQDPEGHGPRCSRPPGVARPNLLWDNRHVSQAD